jgi:hypothetical protein
MGGGQDQEADREVTCPSREGVDHLQLVPFSSLPGLTPASICRRDSARDCCRSGQLAARKRKRVTTVTAEG